MNFNFWNVMVDIGFWTRLTHKKLEQYKLDTLPKPLIAKYRLSNKPDKLSILSIDAYSFGDTIEEEKSGPVEVKIKGQFINTNTIEQFNKIDAQHQQQSLIKQQTQNIIQIIEGKQIEFTIRIKLLIFGDFKKHTFKYQFLSSARSINHIETIDIQPVKSVINDIKPLNEYVKHFIARGCPVPQLVILKDYQIVTLKEYISNPQEPNYLFCITDTTNYPNTTGYHTNTILGIFIELRERNLVKAEHLQNIKILLMKEYLIYNTNINYSFNNSEIWSINLSKAQYKPFEERFCHPKKLLELDLKSFMDDRTLAREAVDLNIKLMKWRVMPSLDIPKIQSRKCLLFGAGTLGCQLARNLIGWGVKHITFIDSSKVSYSNPVRQSLYEYEDTIKGGKPKAQTAAQKLMKIYPEIHSEGYNIHIPMPGHFVTKQEHVKQTLQNLDLIEKLVSQHDVLFLLLDSRQARWLPTVLANKYDKACITVGLGFDSFVIVRHGVSPNIFQEAKHKQRICCYFCNDIITPQNTMKDRTLDQMCTVTRPGLSFLASAYASQLYISLLHHPQEHHVCAHEDVEKLQTTELGKLPHHIRGNMSDFETNIFYGRAFEKCVACSKYILDQYNSNRDEFMLKILNDPSFIHHVVDLEKQLASYQANIGTIIEIVDDEDIQGGYLTISEETNQSSLK